MPKPKKDIPTTLFTGNDKDILLAYCQGLPESKCKKAYLILREEFSPDCTRYVRFNELGKQDDSGLVKLKKRQLNLLLKRDGEFVTEWKIKRLHGYIKFLKDNMDKSLDSKRKWKRYRDSDHYQVLANGWVHEAYLKEAPVPPVASGRIDFYSIRTGEEAIKYIEQEGLEYLSDSPELEFLTNRYHVVAEYIIKALEKDKTIGYSNARTEQ